MTKNNYLKHKKIFQALNKKQKIEFIYLIERSKYLLFKIYIQEISITQPKYIWKISNRIRKIFNVSKD